MPFAELQIKALIDAVDAKFLTVAKWIDNHESRINQLEGRLARLEMLENDRKHKEQE